MEFLISWLRESHSVGAAHFVQTDTAFILHWKLLRVEFLHEVNMPHNVNNYRGNRYNKSHNSENWGSINVAEYPLGDSGQELKWYTCNDQASDRVLRGFKDHLALAQVGSFLQKSEQDDDNEDGEANQEGEWQDAQIS